MNQQLGNKGEKLAIEYLSSLGYIILENNWRYGHLEVDVIAKDKSELVFIEVKTRVTKDFGQPERAVSWRKQLFLSSAADAYVHQNNFNGETRFDIISIIYKNKLLELEHFKDAFWPGVL